MVRPFAFALALFHLSIAGAWEAETLSDDTFQDARRTEVVRLSEPVSEDILDTIAFRLWGRQSHVAKHYLPGMTPGASVWAMAIHDPREDPHMQITIGFTAETQVK